MMKKGLLLTTILALMSSNAVAKNDCGTKEGDVLKTNCWECGSNCTARLDADGAMTITGSGSMKNYGDGKSPWQEKMDNIKSVTIDEGINNVGFYAFKGAKQLASVSLSNSVTSIDYQSFNGASSLTNVNIPTSVTKIGDSAFAGTTSLQSAHIADGSQLATIGYGVFESSGLSNINLPDTLTSLGRDAFKNAVNLESINIPDNVTLLVSTFKGATNLKTVNISENSKLETIGENAFSSTGIITFNVPDSVKTIDTAAFYQSALQTVNISENSILETIGFNAFCSTDIAKINLPETLTSIGRSALGYSHLSGDLKIPDSVTTIGDAAFHSSGLNSIVFSEDSQLETLNSNAFANAHTLETIILPPNFQFNPDTVLNLINTDKLQTLYLTPEQAENIEITGKASTFAPMVYQISEDGIIVSQNGREMNKYESFSDMISGEWTERYEYSEDTKYGGLRQEAFAKDGDGEKYLGAKIFRPDGSIVLVDENNKFINKLHAKIYTVEEAMAVTREGNVNRVRLTYK